MLTNLDAQGAVNLRLNFLSCLRRKEKRLLAMEEVMGQHFSITSGKAAFKSLSSSLTP